MALLLSFISHPQFMADTIVAQTPAINRTRILPRNTPGRPKAPSRNDYIDIIAGPGFVECTFPAHIEGVYLVVGDKSAPVAAGFVTVDEPRMEIPEIHGEYPLSCTTDEGDEYIGSMWFY